VDILDIVLVVLAALSVLHGVRVGAAAQLVTCIGLACGLATGVALVLLLDPHISGQTTKTLVAAVLLIGPAAIFGGVGRQVGIRLWQVLRRGRFGPVDAGLGALTAVATTLTVCWLFASILVNSAYQGVSRQIEDSRIIRSIENIMPPVPDAFAAVDRYLSVDGFPQVLVNVLPEAIGPVALPDTRQVREGVAIAGPSTVKVVAIGCGDEQEGTGFIAYASSREDLVVTNAHVVAGTATISVEAPDGVDDRATPVLFDPLFDLAVLKTAPLHEPSLTIDPSDIERGTATIVLGYPGGGPFTSRPAGVVSRFEAEGRDIYDSAITIRTVYELQAVVRPGNSGGPLVLPDGEVVGVVFSRSVTNSDIGYALASPGVLSRLDLALHHPAGSGTGHCTS